MSLTFFIRLLYGVIFSWGYWKWDFPPGLSLSIFDIGIWKLILYTHLYPEPICWLCFSQEFQVVSFIFGIISSANWDTLTSSLPILFPLVLNCIKFYFHCVLKSRKSRHPCLVHDFNQTASRFSPFTITFLGTLWHSTFIILKHISCITRFSRILSQKAVASCPFMHSLR